MPDIDKMDTPTYNKIDEPQLIEKEEIDVTKKSEHKEAKNPIYIIIADSIVQSYVNTEEEAKQAIINLSESIEREDGYTYHFEWNLENTCITVTRTYKWYIIQYDEYVATLRYKKISYSS